MKHILFYTACCLAVNCPVIVPAQIALPQAFNAKATLDINNIEALHLVHGDMWWDPEAGEAKLEFPKGSGKNASFTTTLWMGGYDAAQVLHVAAQTYRENGNDYWPGPLENNQPRPYDSTAHWAKIWKVNRAAINTFLAATTHNPGTIPAAILSWPAKGNPYAYGVDALHISRDMAPFVDVNGDGVYNAVQGDYPRIKGDQMLWWVINDNGPVHTESNGLPLGLEIKISAYAYKRGSAIDNILFYEYNITNRSGNNYTDYRFGLFSATNLGNAFDDYIGFDSSHRMGITYNAREQDDIYGYNPPMTGVTLLETPGDNGTSYEPVGKFTYYNNDYTVIGNPSVDTEYYNYLSGRTKAGIHFSNDWDNIPGHNSKAYYTGNDVDYVFPGNPSDSSQWSECVCYNKADDRRFIISAAPRAFNAGSTLKYALAFVITDTGSLHTCPGADFSDVRAMADTAWKWYHASATNIAPINMERKSLTLYPNPAHQNLFVATTPGKGTLTIYDAMGKQCKLPAIEKNGTTELDIHTLAPGVYMILYTTAGQQQSGIFVKE